LDLPLRQMMLPFIGRLPVSSQIFAITILFQIKNRRSYHRRGPWQADSLQFPRALAPA
jgi:hypothetical protein